MEQTEQNKLQLEQLDKKLQENSQSLHINRVPLRIKREFKSWADAEFSGEDGKGDYGMALKWLWEGRLDVAAIQQQFAEVELRLARLEQRPAEEPKVRRMLDGRMIHPRS